MSTDEPFDPDQSPAWLPRVQRRLKRWCKTEAQKSWVVAVSGGSDSVGLLRVLHRLAPELGLSLSVAHLDHGVRGAAADDDARFVARLAAALGLPFDLGDWQPGPYRNISRPMPAAPAMPGCTRWRPRGGLDRGSRPHARRPGRDRPAPDHPRYRPERAGRHTGAAHPHRPAGSHARPTAPDDFTPGNARVPRVAGAGIPRRCQQRRSGPDPRTFATTCCRGWLTIIIPRLLMRSSGWERWHAPRKGPWKTGCGRSATPQP